ncbi:fibrocystin-L-like [Dysidea avara]|uniref:fibrocystin-L-like n=1 Tax=Dysidea avara TaxID=196820 RepID=UPI0033246954
MRFHLVYAEESDAIRIAFKYTNPQRLDIYYGDSYINPKNVEEDENGELVFKSKDPSLPYDQFLPTLDDPAGSNFYERSLEQLYFILRGNTPITVRTAPVIQLAINLPPVTVDEFFEDNLVNNLATLLGIDKSRIRVVNVISEASNRKRQVEGTSVEIEIGNPPETTLNNENDTATNETTTTDPNALDFDILENVTSMVAEVIQTGQLEEMLNISILSADVQPPVAPPVDPTSGVRATPDTGGPQPGEVENGTLTFGDRLNTSESDDTGPITLAIPSELRLLSQPEGGIEGLSLTPTPILAVYDNNGEVVTNLGIGDPWVASIVVTSTGQSSVQVMPDTEVTFIGGYANLTDISITHPGFGYVLTFTVTDPPVGFTMDTAPFDVSKREFIINVVQGSQTGSTALELSPYPIVELLDKGILEKVTNIGWRGRKWFAKLKLKTASGSSTGLEWTAEFNSNDTTAAFSKVLISTPGSYLMVFTVFTIPDSDIIIAGVEYSLTISTFPSAKMGFVLDADYDTVVSNDKMSFISSVDNQLSNILPDITIYNISIAKGSIVVDFYIQSANRQAVMDAISTFMNTDIVIEYNGQTYFATSKTTSFIGASDDDKNDDNDDDENDDDDETVIIIGAVVGGTILIVLMGLFILVCYSCHKKRNSKEYATTSHGNAEKYETREMNWQTSSSALVKENEGASMMTFNDKPEKLAIDNPVYTGDYN